MYPSSHSRVQNRPVNPDRLSQPDRLAQALELLDRYLAQRLREGLGPGVAMALTDRRQLLGVLTHGLADVATQRPVTPETLFQIGSISKAFTAAALLRQCEAGRLDLHVPVTQYLDWFKVQSAYDEPITAHHLLSHTAGLVCMTDTAPCSRYVVWNLRNTHTGFAPGTHFHYSNLGYRVLGHILENLTGQPYADALCTQVLEPLGMMESAPTITHDVYERMAVGYWSTHYDDRPAPPNESPFPVPWFEFDGASGSVVCTAADLATFLRMLLNWGQSDHGTFLSEESFASMSQPVIESDFGYASGYGLFTGEREEFDGHTMVYTGGEMIGYHSVITGDMTDGIGVVVLVNGEEYGLEEADFALKVLHAVIYDQELPALPATRAPRTRVDNAAEYAGVYCSPSRMFELVAEGDQLVMLHRNERIVLERWFPGAFYVPHPDFKLSFLKFGRAEGTVVEAFHGADWYQGQHYDGPINFDYPAEWDAYVGHYRTYSPWMSNFRFFVRKGQPYLQWFGTFEQPLTALGDGSFRIGKAEYSPERLRFDCLVEGQALRATLSGGDYYRVETP